MAKIAFILLCHKNPADIIQQAQRLTAAGDYIAIHFDARASAADYGQIAQALQDDPAVTFAARRVKCGWGEWSLVQATLHAVTAAMDAFADATHFYMISGDCMPIKSAVYLRDALNSEDCDYIEGVDFYRGDWIKTGLREERLDYRHWFNERRHKALFDLSLNIQSRLGLKRNPPSDLTMMIGSQWWCLRRATVEVLLEFVAHRADVVRFFRKTWIPDETFFQTLVHHLIPATEIKSRALTFLMFTDYGMPVAFYNDHYDLLIGQDTAFARKISPEAVELKDRLGELYISDQRDFTVTNEGRPLFQFLTGQGRIGRRFAQRIWECESTLGRERRLVIIACKKWHVAKRLVAAMHAQLDVPALEFIFDEEHTDMPDLGGMQTSLTKRTRHRRALIRQLYAHFGRDELVICLDPKNLDLMRDLFDGQAQVALLEITCGFSDDYLVGHAARVGLAHPSSPPEVVRRLLPTLRHDIQLESERIRDADFPTCGRIFDTVSPARNAVVLADLLDIEMEVALALATTPHLFAD